VRQSHSKRARRNPSPRIIKVTVHEETKGQWKNNHTLQHPTHNHDSAAPRQHPAHLHWCGTDPPSSKPTHVAGHRGDPPKRGYISAIFAGYISSGKFPVPAPRCSRNLLHNLQLTSDRCLIFASHLATRMIPAIAISSRLLCLQGTRRSLKCFSKNAVLSFCLNVKSAVHVPCEGWFILPCSALACTHDFKNFLSSIQVFCCKTLLLIRCLMLLLVCAVLYVITFTSFFISSPECAFQGLITKDASLQWLNLRSWRITPMTQFAKFAKQIQFNVFQTHWKYHCVSVTMHTDATVSMRINVFHWWWWLLLLSLLEK